MHGRRWLLGIFGLVAALVSGPAVASRPLDCSPAEFVVFFETDVARLTDKSVNTLGNVLAEWRKYKGQLLVEGHTNRNEERTVAGDLGMLRAKTVSDWLSANGADSRSVWIQDRRTSALLVQGHPDAPDNSRAQIKVTKGNACERADRKRAEWAGENCLGPVDWIRNAQACNAVLNDIGMGFR